MSGKKNIVILGAGVAGLAAGYFLSRSGRYQVTVLEQSPVTGGMCASFKHEGFVLDYGPHKLYSAIPGILDEISLLMNDRLLKLPKKNRIYLRGHLLDYPLRLTNLLKVLGIPGFFKFGMGYVSSVIRGFWDKKPAQSYEEYIIKLFGKPAYEIIFKPLAEKVWGAPAQLHPDMAKIRVSSSNGLEVILRLLGLKKETKNTNADFFFYPRRGFGDWPQKLQEELQTQNGNVFTAVQVKELERENGHIKTVKALINGREQSFLCDYLISSIPLPVLNRLAAAKEKSDSRYEADRLQFRHLILVYVFVKRPFVLTDQWIFFPEKEFVFGRIFEQKQMNPDLGPKDQTAICCDFTCDEESALWKADDADLAQKCVEGLARAGFIKSNEITGYLVKRQRNFYPRYDQQYLEKIQAVNDQLKEVKNLILTGRQ